jgi:putative addiction module component (TIGR02574 family)
MMIGYEIAAMIHRMTDAILQSAMKLTPAERILLAERLWDSIADENAAPPLTKAQATELNRRIRRIRKTGPLGADWATVKARISRRKNA